MIKRIMSLAAAVALLLTSFTFVNVPAKAADNDDFSTAQDYTVENTINGHLSDTDYEDYFKFHVSEDSCFKVELTTEIEHGKTQFQFFNFTEERIRSVGLEVDDPDLGYNVNNFYIYLNPGTYYVRVANETLLSLDNYSGDYSFKLTDETSFTTNVYEPNDTADTASLISVGEKYTTMFPTWYNYDYDLEKGYFTKDRTDMFKFIITDEGNYKVHVYSVFSGTVDMLKEDAYGEPFEYSSYPVQMCPGSNRNHDVTLTLTAGTYYIRFSADGSGYANFSIKSETAASSGSSQTNTGKNTNTGTTANTGNTGNPASTKSTGTKSTGTKSNYSSSSNTSNTTKVNEKRRTIIDTLTPLRKKITVRRGRQFKVVFKVSYKSFYDSDPYTGYRLQRDISGRMLSARFGSAKFKGPYRIVIKGRAKRLGNAKVNITALSAHDDDTDGIALSKFVTVRVRR